MAFSTQPVSATIIPFPHGAKVRGKLLGSDRRVTEEIVNAPLPVVDTGSWYHEEAVRQAERELRA